MGSTYSVLVNVTRSREVVTYFMMFHLVICNASYTKLLSLRREEKLRHIWNKNCLELPYETKSKTEKIRNVSFCKSFATFKETLGRWKIDFIFC